MRKLVLVLVFACTCAASMVHAVELELRFPYFGFECTPPPSEDIPTEGACKSDDFYVEWTFGTYQPWFHLKRDEFITMIRSGHFSAEDPRYPGAVLLAPSYAIPDEDRVFEPPFNDKSLCHLGRNQPAAADEASPLYRNPLSAFATFRRSGGFLQAGIADFSTEDKIPVIRCFVDMTGDGLLTLDFYGHSEYSPPRAEMLALISVYIRRPYPIWLWPRRPH